MRNFLAILILLLTAAGSARGESPANGATNLWFPVGETLVYHIYWGFIPVGSTQVTTEWIDMGGKPMIAIRYRTTSNKVIEKLYPVNDFIESIVDPQTFRSVTFRHTLHEGRRQSDEFTVFDYEAGVARWESRTKGKRRDYPIDPDIRDFVAYIYWIRQFPFSPGETRHDRVFAEGKTYDVWIRVKEAEEVDLGSVFGKVESLKIEPEAAFNGLFYRKGKLTLWVSTDSRRAMTRLIGTVPVASINVLLDQVYGPGDDSWTRKTPPRADPGEDS